MSQQVFNKYWPKGKDDENNYISGAALLQTRDGQDEPITPAASYQKDESGVFLPTNKDNPLEVRVRELENELQQLRQTLTDGDAKVQLSGHTESFTHHDNTPSSGWGPILDVSKFGGLLVTVNGEFTGTVRFYDYGAGNRPLALTETNGTFHPAGAVSKQGQYYIDLSGRNWMRTRVDITSGSVDVRSVAFQDASERYVTTVPSNRIVLIDSFSGSVEPGATKLMPMVDVKPFVFFFVNAAMIGSWSIEYQWMRSTVAAFQNRRVLIQGEGRDVSEWQEVVGTSLDLWVVNHETTASSAHSIQIYGVR